MHVRGKNQGKHAYVILEHFLVFVFEDSRWPDKHNSYGGNDYYYI